MKARPPYIRAMMEPAVALAYREAGRGRGSAGHGGERAGGRLPRITVLEVMAADRGGVRERAVIRLSLLRGVVGSRGRLRDPPHPPGSQTTGGLLQLGLTVCLLLCRIAPLRHSCSVGAFLGMT